MHIAVVLRSQERLAGAIDRLLRAGKLAAQLDTPSGSHAVPDLAALLQRDDHWFHWRSRQWVLHGATLDPAVPQVSARSMKDPSWREREAIAQTLSRRYEWAIIEWGGTYQESCAAFVTAGSATMREFLAANDAVLGSYEALTAVDAMRTIVFADDGYEGEVAWEVAQLEGSAPLLACRFEPASGDWWCDGVSRLEEIAREGEMALFRAKDADAWRKLWSRAGYDDGVAQCAVSGHAAPAEVMRHLHGKPGGLEPLRDLSEVAGWAYGHCYGGGADEYVATFRARTDKLARRATNLLEAAEEENRMERWGYL